MIMKKVLLFVVGVILLMLAIPGAVVLYYQRIIDGPARQLAAPVQPGRLGRWVNPFIGTGGVPWVCGNNYPGASLPYGMLRLSPETASLLIDKRALNTSGYFYGDNKIIGFSHTRLGGTGAIEGGHFRLFPVAGKVIQSMISGETCAAFSHRDEAAFPGYYAVKLSGPGILVELTATQRAGYHRYTFPAGKIPHLLLDIGSALGTGTSKNGSVQVAAETGEAQGSVTTFGSFSGRYGGSTVFFAAKSNPPFSGFSVWNGGKRLPNQSSAAGDSLSVDLQYSLSDMPSVVELKLAISYVSLANARANLEVETAGIGFETIVARAKQTWENKLGLIELHGGSDKQKAIFYTALYRTFQMPTVFNDCNNEYRGFDKKIHRAQGYRYFTDLSLWDTFRTAHPLYNLIAPHDQRDMVFSLLQMKEQGGWLPRWPSGYGYTNSMLGTPADIVIAESYLKGLRDFDAQSAYAAMKQTALAPTPYGAVFSGREGVEHYLNYQYCPSDLMREAVSRTFEFGWADAAIANFASALGYEQDAQRFRKHARYYKNLWNPATRYFQPKDSQALFSEKFKPLLLSYVDWERGYTDDYVEGNALQWRWAAFYDAEGMISLFKDKSYFIAELEAFFSRTNKEIGRWYPGTGYWHGNQPDLHAAYLFNTAGRPDLTQKWVRHLLETKYDTTAVGLDGNDDGGSLSAWYVFSALGFYPIPGTDRYQVAAPLFSRADVRVAGGVLRIVADNASSQNIYVRNLWLNDSLLTRRWLKHAELVRGGELRFEMATRPPAKGRLENADLSE